MTTPNSPESQWQNPQGAPGQDPYAVPHAEAQPPAAPPPYATPPGNYPGPGYGAPGYGYGYPQSAGTNGMAIASMVLGILWLYWIGSILALIFGYIARGQIRQRGQSGDGMAIAGIVLGWIGVGLLLLLIVIGVAAGAGMFG